MSMMIKLARPIRLLGGVIFHKDETVNLSPVKGCPMIGEISARGITKRIHYVRIFNGPTRGIVAIHVTRNQCSSVAGEWCQPGGTDRSGFPCWSLVYGMQTLRGV